jgi:hypothetical protein
VDDVVLARSEVGDESSLQRVTKRWVHEDRRTIRLRLDNGEVLGTTAAHRVFVEGKGFVSVNRLVPGDRVGTLASGHVTVTAIEPGSTRATVYNLSVERFPTYFVGQSGVWVHNVKLTTNPSGEGDGETGRLTAEDE